MPYVADSEQSHVMRLWNVSLNWVVSPSLVNQITVASGLFRYEPPSRTYGTLRKETQELYADYKPGNVDRKYSSSR